LHLLLYPLLYGCTSSPGGPATAAPIAAPSEVDVEEEQTIGPVDGALEGEAVYFIDDDVGALVRYTPYDGLRTSLALGSPPGRLARAGDRVWVTLPAERGIAVVEDVSGHLSLRGTLPTGAEPLGIAVTADGERLYVAASTAGEVEELDADGTLLRSWPIDGQPSWLALSPDEGSVYVGSAYGATLTWIDLVGGAANAVTLPSASRTVDGWRRVLTPRITGDLAVSADGTRLAVPMLYVDTVTPVGDPTDDTPEPSDGYASGGGVSRINPVVALVGLDPGGEPDGPGATLDLVTGSDDNFNALRSYLTSVAFPPTQDFLLATMEASGAVIGLSLTESVFETGGLSDAHIVTISAPAGPRAIMFASDDLAFFDCFLDRSVGFVELRRPRAALRVNNEMVEGSSRDGADSPLDSDVVAGRARFYSAIDASMSVASGGVSCSTCHTNGRNDGLSWPLEAGPRQTPSLAGGISGAAPFTWTSDVASVADEVMITSQDRMGGVGLSDGAAAQVAAFIDTIRAPDAPDLGSTDPSVRRGQAIFERADVGCADCHSGALYTDNQSWALFGLEAVNTPSLRRVSTTAPYLHDGRAATLQDLLALCADGSMGDTSMLSAAELVDLESYLRSL
jgi:DNA-binding beta-propeller fold protein YncE/mono/diheme cytochrome c family protein